jgi:spore maturation protein CgeB
LAERSLEHERLFQDGKEAVFYDNKEDLIKKIKYYLINKEKRDRIAYAGYKKCQTGDYTHENRMRFMLKVTLDAGKLS